MQNKYLNFIFVDYYSQTLVHIAFLFKCIDLVLVYQSNLWQIMLHSALYSKFRFFMNEFHHSACVFRFAEIIVVGYTVILADWQIHYSNSLFKPLISVKGVKDSRVIWCDFDLFSVVCSCLYMYKICRVTKLKVSHKRVYSILKTRLIQTGLKKLIQTHPHTSTSRCGNICIMLPKCARKERRLGFSNRSSVDAAISGRCCGPH